MKYFISFLLACCVHSVCATNEVIYIWSGGLTDTSINVNAKLTDSSSAVRLILSESPQFTSPLFSAYYHVDSTTNMMLAMHIGGLTPSTKYYYGVESDGVADTSADDVGSFTTSSATAFSFYFVAGSCCLNSDHVVYTIMKNSQPLFYTCLGDMHYANPNSATDVNVHRNAYENYVLSKPAAAALFKEVPVEYVWDDHDFSGNDSDSSFAGKANARQAYREYVPHYPLPAGNGNAAIYQSYVIGRVHFIHTDLRSDRYGNSMMGSVQKAWFKNECIAARDSNQLIIWISSTTWNGTFIDNWGGFQGERTELANFFRDNQIANMLIVCGDAHMLAIDDGTDGDFSTQVYNPYRYPIFNTAALNQGGSYKGGIFNQGGVFPNPDYTYGQFGLIQIIDTGGLSLCVNLAGYRTDVNGDIITQVNHYSFCRTLGPSPAAIAPLMKQDEVSVFPNPSDGKFVFETNEQVSDLKVEITDASGRKILTEYKYEISGNHVQFFLDNFSPGIYFVSMTSGENIYRKEIVITE
jgi:alkaline phosphatase D